MKVLNKKYLQLIFIMIIFFTILELYNIYKFYFDYKGIYQVYFFTPVIILQGITWYSLIFKKEIVRRYKLRIVINALITILIPILMITMQPEYSYQDGKLLIEMNIGEEEEYVFAEYPMGQSTIPVANNPKSIFVADRNYYYKLSGGINTMFFMVNPIDGKVMELDNEYWLEDTLEN